MVKNKQDALNLYNSLDKLGDLTGVKFAYGISKNINILKPEVDALQEASKPSDEFTAYEKLREELLKKHAKKDKDDKPVIVDNSYVLADQKGFDVGFKKIQKEHKKAIDDRQAQVDEVEKLLKEKVEVKLHMIKTEDVPENISTAQFHSISDLIED